MSDGERYLIGIVGGWLVVLCGCFLAFWALSRPAEKGTKKNNEQRATTNPSAINQSGNTHQFFLMLVSSSRRLARSFSSNCPGTVISVLRGEGRRRRAGDAEADAEVVAGVYRISPGVSASAGLSRAGF